jgi:3-isopropylmalate/(R)-2-methylmalate dehydratase large subunit
MAQKRGLTAYQKIVEAHLLKVLEDGRLVLRVDMRFCHEITTPNAIIEGRARGFDIVYDPNTVKAMIDHISPAKDTDSAVQGKLLREWCRQHDIEFFDVGNNGVCHALIPEKGLIMPGQIAVMGDSHTCTHGAFGAFAAGVGSTDLLTAIAFGFWVCPSQRVIRVNFEGNLPDHVFAKDLILALIGRIGVKGATNAILEFGGPVIEAMSMDARMTITNMAVEAGATSGMMAVDGTTMLYLWPAIKRVYNSEGDDFVTDVFDTDYPECRDAARDYFAFNSDADAEYDQVVTIDVTDMVPMITEGFTVGEVVPVEKLAGKPIDQVYIGSCTNGRIEDLRVAADIFEDFGPVAANVRCIVNPGTTEVYRMALEEGHIKTFLEAGCCVTNPSCGACLGLSCGVIAPGEVCLSTTNRNFPGRMGKDGMVHLASPATAAYSATLGMIAVPDGVTASDRSYYEVPPMSAKPTGFQSVQCQKVNYAELAAKQAAGQKDFSGMPFYLPVDNLDTDRIIPGRCLTLTDKTEMGKHCLEDADLSPRERNVLAHCQILVAGDNFGCGSSREHAPWALEAAGIRCVIAKSFARIFQENMFANGLLCIEVDAAIVDALHVIRPTKITIDWHEGVISCTNTMDAYVTDAIVFALSGHQKKLLAHGGSIGVMLNMAAELQQAGKL